MSSRLGHAPLRSISAGWLAALADPMGRKSTPNRPVAADQLPILIEAAAVHGVLPATVRNLRAIAAVRGAAGVVDNGQADRVLTEALALADERIILQTGVGLLLMHHAKRVGAALTEQGIKWTVVKGDVFSRRLYPNPSDRTFTDVDLLIPPSAIEESRVVMERLGFRMGASECRGDRTLYEEKWVLPDNDAVLVEIQTNLIHSPALGAAIGLGYDDLHMAGGGDPEDLTALLLVAAVHGIAGHQFQRLQQVVDVLQAARGSAGPIDTARLKHAARVTGSTVALQASLDVAAALFDDPATRDLAERLELARWRRVRRILLSTPVVMRAQSAIGARDSWRRRAIREMIKLTARER